MVFKMIIKDYKKTLRNWQVEYMIETVVLLMEVNQMFRIAVIDEELE